MDEHILRIEEPFIKVHLALWLVAKGARIVTVSVDGAEPHPNTVQEVLLNGGFVHERDLKSRTTWAGLYRRQDAVVAVGSKAGTDVLGVLPGERTFCAECKGEPTESQARSGGDRTAFYTGLGQILMISGRDPRVPDELALVVPERKRFAELASDAVQNPLLKKTGLRVLLVNEAGEVSAAD